MGSPLQESIQLIIPVVSVFVSYFLGQRQSEKKYEREQAKLRYDSFYVPLFQFLYAGRMSERSGSSLRFDARSKLLDMFTHNIALLGPGLQSCYPDLLAAYTAMLHFDSCEPDYKDAPDEFDRVFNRIEKYAIAESKELSRALRLPSIAQTYENDLLRLRGSKPSQAKSKQQPRS